MLSSLSEKNLQGKILHFFDELEHAEMNDILVLFIKLRIFRLERKQIKRKARAQAPSESAAVQPGTGIVLSVILPVKIVVSSSASIAKRSATASAGKFLRAPCAES